MARTMMTATVAPTAIAMTPSTAAVLNPVRPGSRAGMAAEVMADSLEAESRREICLDRRELGVRRGAGRLDRVVDRHDDFEVALEFRLGA